MKSSKHTFAVSVEVNQATGEVIAVYFRVRKGKSARTQEFANGNLFADYNSNGDLLGVEMLAPCSIRILERVTQSEPETQQFVRRSVPRAMVLA